MKIVILDAYRTNPGDVSWKKLEDLGTLVTYDRTPPEQVVERSRGAEAVLVNKTVLTGDMLRALPDLKYIGVLATGTNVVDIETAHELGIVVTNIPAYSTDSVAQTAFALLLAICIHPEHYTQRNRMGEWSRSQDFCYWEYPLIELAGLQMGIVGMGNIGMRMTAIAQAMGMRVAAFSSKSPDALPQGVTKMELDELFASSDVVSIHCPLTPQTRNMVNASRLALMKPTAILINTSRGPIVDEQALAQALKEHKIYAAGLDVMSQEPPEADNPLFGVDNCIITPHVAWATKAARLRLITIAAENLRAFIEGRKLNVV